MSASQAYNYYLQAWHQITPRQMNISMADGYGWSEFPILYYISGMLSKVVGYDTGWLSLLSLLLWMAGCMAIPGIVYRHTHRRWPSFLIGALFFCSPLVAFYSTTGLPDVAALAFFFLGWNLLYKAKDLNRTVLLITSQGFFALAGLLKPTILIVYLAWFLLSVASQLPLFKSFRDPWRNAVFRRKFLTTGITVLTLVAGYHLFAVVWNKTHQSGFFLQSAMTFWDSHSLPVRSYIMERTMTEWLPQVFHPLTFLVMGAGLLLALFRFRKVPLWMWTWTGLSLAGTGAYYLLFYYQFLHHDYYLLAWYPVVLLCLLLILESVKIPGRSLAGTLFYILVFSGALWWNAVYTAGQITERYEGKYSNRYHESFYEVMLSHHLHALGIDEGTKVISVPDVSPSGTLYMLKRHGFTDWTGNGLPRMVESDFHRYVKEGATCLVVSDPAWLEDRPWVNTYIYETLPPFRGLRFYTLSIPD